MPITHIYNLEFRYKEGRFIASLKLEAPNKKTANKTGRNMAQSLSLLLADHFEKWIGYRRENSVEVFVTPEPNKDV